MQNCAGEKVWSGAVIQSSWTTPWGTKLDLLAHPRKPDPGIKHETWANPPIQISELSTWLPEQRKLLRTQGSSACKTSLANSIKPVVHLTLEPKILPSGKGVVPRAGHDAGPLNRTFQPDPMKVSICPKRGWLINKSIFVALSSPHPCSCSKAVSCIPSSRHRDRHLPIECRLLLALPSAKNTHLPRKGYLLT